MPISTRLWLINATNDLTALDDLCRQAQAVNQVVHILYRAADSPRVVSVTAPAADIVRLVELTDGALEFPDALAMDEAEILFLPCVGDIDWADLQKRPPLDHPDALQPIITVPSNFDPVQDQVQTVTWFGWRAGLKLARRILREPSAWQLNGLELVEALQHSPSPPRWQSIPVPAVAGDAVPAPATPVLTMNSRVLAVISYYKCEEWLEACLDSMVHQTRPPENIVVIDDFSPALPTDIVKRFPNVTLLSTTQNIGPEKILNNVIRATDYDAYMVQDPDDWAACDRLELSLRHAESTGAELVGTQEFTIDHAKAWLELHTFPADVNHALAKDSAHCLLHCTGLFSRSLVMRIGGFDENLKLGADTDFVVRAWHAGRIVNLPSFCVFHRVRAGSLTTHPDTGHESRARQIEAKFIRIRNKKNIEAIHASRSPTFVVKQKTPVKFIHRQGPRLKLIDPPEGETPLSTVVDARERPPTAKEVQKAKEDVWLKMRRRRFQKAVRTRRLSVIAINCWGMEIYRDLEIPYQTPFANLFMEPSCFVGFLENFEEAIRAPLEFVEESRQHGKVPYPVGQLMGRYQLHFMHYKSREEATEKWYRRRERIAPDRDDCYFMMMRLEGSYIDELRRFEDLPFRNKLLFVGQNFPELHSAIVVPPVEEETGVAANKFYTRCQDYFDLAAWLNKEPQPDRLRRKSDLTV